MTRNDLAQQHHTLSRKATHRDGTAKNHWRLHCKQRHRHSLGRIWPVYRETDPNLQFIDS